MPLPVPWPGTPGGAYSPSWGGLIKLYVWAGIYAGSNMKWGPPKPTDQLDAGNVWGGGQTSPTPPAGQLWVDLSCDVIDLQTHIGGSRSDGAIAQAEAGTCSLTLADPDRIYDPTNPNSPFQYGGQTRLAPGAALIVFAELDSPELLVGFLLTENSDQLITEAGELLVADQLDQDGLVQYRIFTGTVDTWSEDWMLHPADRKASVVASDAVKDLVELDYGEQPAAGAGDTVDSRISRILTYYGWTGSKVLDSSTNTLQATTFAQSAWELIGRATEDELGFTYLDQLGTLRFKNRSTWSTRPTPVLTVGCAPAVTAYDTMVTADIDAASLDIKNAVYAAVVGGTQQVVRAETSIARYGLHSYKRTDLGLQADAQAASWAAFLVSLQSTPRPQLTGLTITPRFDPTIWPVLLTLSLVTDRVRVLWTPPDMTATTELTGRAVAISHAITGSQWDVGLELVMADIFSNVMHWGVHPKDKLTVGNVYV